MDIMPRVVEMPKKLWVKPVTISAQPKRIIKIAMIVIPRGRIGFMVLILLWIEELQVSCDLVAESW